MVFPVIFGYAQVAEQTLEFFRGLRRDLSVFEVEARRVDDRAFFHEVRRKLHVGGPAPESALVEDKIHEEARADRGSLSLGVDAERFLRRVVRPDQVLGREVVVKALLFRYVKVDAEFDIRAVAVAEPRVVVAVEHDDDGIGIAPQLVNEPRDPLRRVGDRA